MLLYPVLILVQNSSNQVDDDEGNKTKSANIFNQTASDHAEINSKDYHKSNGCDACFLGCMVNKCIQYWGKNNKHQVVGYKPDTIADKQEWIFQVVWHFLTNTPTNQKIDHSNSNRVEEATE